MLELVEDNSCSILGNEFTTHRQSTTTGGRALLGSTTTLVNSHHCHLGQRIDQVYHKGMYYYYLCMNSLIELLFEEMSGDVLQAISFCDADDIAIGLGEGWEG